MPYESDEADQHVLYAQLTALAACLGRIFRTHRLASRMSQAEVGGRARLSSDDVSRIETGDPSPGALKALSGYGNNLGVPEELSVLYRVVAFASRSLQSGSTSVSPTAGNNDARRQEISPDFWRSLNAPHS